MKYIIWAALVISTYAYAQYNGYYLPSFFGGAKWQHSGQTLNHK